MDNLTRQSKDGHIHPAVVLGLARKYGIPDLIAPSVKALARQDIQLSTWSTDEAIICHNATIELGVIGKMKEKIFIARVNLRSPPTPLHDNDVCRPNDHNTCATYWKMYWQRSIAPRLLGDDGQLVDELWAIQMKLENDTVSGMKKGCANLTIADTIRKPAWKAETNIQAGAVKALMVDSYSNVDPSW